MAERSFAPFTATAALAAANALASAPKNFIYGTWTGIVNTDTGAPVFVGHLSTKTIQAYGSWTGGGSIKVQGSNDPRVITDSANAVWSDITGISLSANGYKSWTDQFTWVRIQGVGTRSSTEVALCGLKLQR